MAYAPNFLCQGMTIAKIEDIKKSGFEIIDAEVPGNFELDLMRAGKCPDLFFSENTLEAQKLENLHLWYFAEFDAEDGDFLRFEGIDTVSEIFINGTFAARTDNMFIPYEAKSGIRQGRNEVVVHILPVCIEAGKYDVPSGCFAFKYNFSALNIRKAAHMFGWDIMPRIVSAGIWKEVTLEHEKSDKIKDIHFITNRLDGESKTAELRFCINAETGGDFIRDYSVRIHGVCGDSRFEACETLWNYGYQFNLEVRDARLWQPRNCGEQNLYETRVELLCRGEVVDVRELKVGIRTVELEYTDSESEEKIGRFTFRINGRRVFCMGSNWVPLDAFHSQDKKRLGRALEMLDELGCSIVRCWGGNVYESNEFFDFCDEHGIMVWQDFAMGCAVYPQRGEFLSRLEEEAVYQIKRLRNHASLVLWAGDNECDLAYRDWSGYFRDPNKNVLTRRLLGELVELYDYSRPYLPSSPFVSERAFESGLPLPEDHLWGPRDYFKGEFYTGAKSRFASETGYQGMPSPESLSRFLENPERIFDENGEPTAEYKVHAASPELDMNAPYVYRIGLTYSQIVTMFGAAEDNFSDLVRQSQISQAEAKKYFIEKFRLKKWDCTGIIWWNLLDGWPQVSDAVVDYYFVRKLAYHYIKRSQTPVCLMFDEPHGGRLTMYAVNDLRRDVKIRCTVRDIYSGEALAALEFAAHADSSEEVLSLDAEDGRERFLLIEWTAEGRSFKNHYCTKLKNTDYRKYLSAIEKCGFDQFEGF